MNKKILCIASLFLLFMGQISAQNHLWNFDEGSGNIAYDSKGGRRGRDAVNGVLNNAQWVVVDDGYGVQLSGADNSYVSFANPIGQFGTQDFTVAFWFQTNDRSLPLSDLVGNRAASGHGNFFSVRMTNDGYVSAEVDQDAAGTNYIGFRSTQKGLNDGNWHHVAVTRSGTTLTLYIDGYASNSGNGAGVANINNGLVFKIGRSLVDPNTPRFTPSAIYDDLATYNSALSADRIADLAGVPPSTQPQSQNHSWDFDEGYGNIAYDSNTRNPVNGVLNNAQWVVVDDGYGVQITGADNSYVSFANPIGQFGTQDFTVAFWFQTTDKSLSLQDLVGNRAAPGHGNFFSVRMTNDGYVSAEVDQDAAGTNYIGFRSKQNKLNDGNWHHVAVTRSGTTLTLYIDGLASNSGTANGVANINNGLLFKIGRSLVDPNTPRFAPKALFDDLATYNSALSAAQIAQLANVNPNPPASQNHSWDFDEGYGNIAYDSNTRNPVNGVLNNAQWIPVDDGYGVQITGADNSYVSFANPIGQFGTQDFTVAFWFQTSDKSLSVADLVGNRASGGHGNFFSVRMTNDGYVSAEVDQDAAGTNYIGFRSTQKGLNDGNWHHVAVVRSGKNLILYIDGVASNSGNGAGIANINNGLLFKIGRSLVDPNTPRFAPKALFDDLATYNSALSAAQIAQLANVNPNPPTSQNHSWDFDEGYGNIAYDSNTRNPVNGVLNNAKWVVVDDGYGVQITGADNSYVSFANPIGQFGTQDFTVAFWFQTNDKSLALADLVGNRASGGHGNFFAVRITNDGYVSAEVDQDAAGTNYVGLRSKQKGLNDGNWHHVAVTRSGKTLILYVDGLNSNSGNGAGVANINNGLVFKIGRSLVDPNTPRFAPKATFDDLATYNSALSAAQIAQLANVNPNPPPQTQNHLWTFDENTGTIAYDSQGGRNAVNGVLNNAQWRDLSKVGLGAAVHITGADNSYVSFGGGIGQFGTQDFTVAYWFQTTDNSVALVDLVGNRASGGHGNFFSTRLSNDGYVSAEIDQDASGTNYIGFRSSQNGLNDGNWHHVAVVRSGKNLILYIDGTASNSGSANGVTNINTNVIFKIGRSLVDSKTPRFAPDAIFDDLAIYNSALSAAQVNSLYANATNQ